MLKITIQPKTIVTPNGVVIKIYTAVATINLFNKVFATGTSNTNALQNIIKIIQ